MDAYAGRDKPHPENLNDLLDRLCGLVDCGVDPLARDDVSVDEILATVGRRAYGPLLLIVGIFAISPATIIPGMTWLSALLVLLIAVQMALGFARPWLPKAALRVRVPKTLLIKGVHQTRPWARRVDAFLKPRLAFLTVPPFVNIVALVIIAAALVTFPLGFIPFAPLIPGIAIVLISLGMAARDGLFLGLGALTTAGASWFVIDRLA